MQRECDLEGQFHLFDVGQLRRLNAVLSGYRPLHKLHDNYLSSGMHEYPDVARLAPGETARARVWLITPEVYPGCLWIGRQIDVMEGTDKVVGTLTVTRIFNKVLSGTADAYGRMWIDPGNLD